MTRRYAIPGKNINRLTKIFIKVIKERKLIRFYYESKAQKAWRIAEPYILGIKDKGRGNIFIAALPVYNLSKNVRDKKLRHYLLKEMDIEQFEILNETYDVPHVPEKKITHTPTIKVVSRYKYPGEK